MNNCSGMVRDLARKKLKKGGGEVCGFEIKGYLCFSDHIKDIHKVYTIFKQRNSILSRIR